MRLSEAAGSSPRGDRFPEPTASPAIHAVGLSKRFGDTVAVNSLSMTVQRGEVFGFLGPNGAGKTTVVKLLLGLARPTGGEALVLGAPLGDRETRRQIGYLPELFRFQALLTAREVLRLHCRLLALPKATWEEEERSALETVDLLERGNDRVATFSKGMQQRLGLGVALLGNPALVMLDEPTSALDPVGRHDVREIIRGLRERGVHRIPEHAPARRGRARVRPRRGHRQRDGRGHREPRRAARTPQPGATEGRRPWPELVEWSGPLRQWHQQDDWLVVDDIDPSQIAGLVGELVALGGQIQAVIPEHQSLEARFLELLAER